MENQAPCQTEDSVKNINGQSDSEQRQNVNEDSSTSMMMSDNDNTTFVDSEESQKSELGKMEDSGEKEELQQGHSHSNANIIIIKDEINETVSNSSTNKDVTVTTELRNEDSEKEMECDAVQDLHSGPTSSADSTDVKVSTSGDNETISSSASSFFFSQDCDDSDIESTDSKERIKMMTAELDGLNAAPALNPESIVSSNEIMDSGTEWDMGHQELTNVNASTVEGLHTYRTNKSLVVYSDSESDSSAESESDSETVLVSGSSSNAEEDDASDDDSGHDTDGEKKLRSKKKKGKNSDGRIRTDGELFPEELPPLDYLTITAGEDVELEPLGVVSGIVDVLVVISSVDASPALYDDTVLFMENRKPLGLIFETLGTVEKPFYSVRFNSHQDIVNNDIKVDDKVMYAPKASNLTKYVFLAELRKAKCDDASWEDDNEPPVEELNYSDDEQEMKAKRALRTAKWREMRKLREEGSEGRRKKKKRSSKKKNDADAGEGAPNRSGLLKGPLNRNPFGVGDKSQGTHKGQSSKSIYTFGSNMNRPPFMPPNQSGEGFVNPWRAPHPGAMFGGKPSWQEQPGLFGPRPDAPPAFSLAPPSFRPFSNQSNAPIRGPIGPGLFATPNPPNLPGGRPFGMNNRPPPPASGPFANHNPFVSSFNCHVPPPSLPNNRFPNQPPNGPPPQRLFSSFNNPTHPHL